MNRRRTARRVSQPEVRRPTVYELIGKRKLRVMNPHNGVRFVLSLRDWEGVLFSIRAYPCEMLDGQPPRINRHNPFETAHRIVSRSYIEDVLSRVVLC